MAARGNRALDQLAACFKLTCGTRVVSVSWERAGCCGLELATGSGGTLAVLCHFGATAYSLSSLLACP